jgi:hypothetical protein
MTAGQPGTIFEAFNARSLEPHEVASTFVPSFQFELLAKRGHSLVVGPRGSGKTTLLKMLQQSALEAWNGERAEEFRQRIDFTGVFVPTDISWSQKIHCAGKGLDDESRRVFSVAVFTTHVLRALIRAMIDRVAENLPAVRPFRRVQLSDQQESNLCREFCDAWHLNRTVPSLLAIKQAMSLRLNQLREFANEEVARGEEGRKDRVARVKFLHIHFLQAASHAAELFDDLASGSVGKWALLFDELELAPEWIQKELADSVRSTEPNLVFKLAINLFSPNAILVRGADSAMPKQDFEQIPLWHAEKRDAYPFCEKLWQQMLSQYGIARKAPSDVLGSSYFEPPEREWRKGKTAYGPRSQAARRFTELAREDPSFEAYLEKNEIHPRGWSELSSGQRAADVRKVAPLVIVRSFFRKETDDKPSTGRSRKSLYLYSGAESLFAITEGNPRWFIGIVSRLLTRWRDRSQPIKRAIQAEEMDAMANTFSALLGTLPVPAPSQGRGLLSILRTVGDRFHRYVVHDEFSDDPPLTFIIDSFMTGDALDVLASGLNAGAIIYVPDGRSALMLATRDSLQGKRFRISYLLAPVYKLPIRLGRPVALSKILRRGLIESPQLFMDLIDKDE